MSNQVQLQKRLFVKTEECGSKFVDKSTGFIIDSNTCFYNCLYKFITSNKILVPENIKNILDIKRTLTTDLPFDFIFIGNDNPANKNIPADHRVANKASQVFKINIFILTSGTHIYKFGNYEKSLCLFLHKNHYQLVSDNNYSERMQSVFIAPESIFDICIKSDKRRKRGKKKNSPYKDAIQNKNKNITNHQFENSIAAYKVCKNLNFGGNQRKRGNRR